MIKKIIVILLFCSQVYADSIAFDNAAKLGSSSAGSNTVSFTVGSGSNRILWVGTSWANAIEQVTAITYAGVSLTKVDNALHTTTACSLWYLVNPTSGANNIVITALGGVTYFGYASSYSGSKQTGVPDANVKDQTTTASAGSPAPNAINPSITTVADNTWIITVQNGPTWSGTSTDGNVRGFDSAGGILIDKGPNTPAGSFNIDSDTDFSGGSNMASVTASFAPAATAAPLQQATYSIRGGQHIIRGVQVNIK